jgi:hypothetical protein
MAKDPAFLFYSNDFLSGVADLTFEERGQYITLMALQHQKGHLTLKAIKINVPSVTDDVLAKFTVDSEGNYFNERLDLESEKRKAHSEKQKQRALDGWKKRKANESPLNATADATALPLEDEDVNEDINTTTTIKEKEDIEFDVFWNLYDKKEGRATVEYKWQRIKHKDQLLIIEHLPKYVEATPDKKYRKLPMTYLSQKTWLDEELPSHGNSKETNNPVHIDYSKVDYTVRQNRSN